MLFIYQALNPDGSVLKGKGQFNNIQGLIDTLSSHDQILLQYQEKRIILSDFINGAVQPRIQRMDIVEFCESLASMIGSGLPLLDSMESITATIKKKRLKDALARVIQEIARGESLSGAFALEPDVFPQMLVFFCSIGEETGTIQDALKNTADHLKRTDNIISQTKRALIYPSFVITAMGSVMVFWLFFVLPRLVETFKDMNVVLPKVTVRLVHFVELFKEYWYILPILIILLGAVFYSLKKNERMSILMAKASFKIPIVGNLLKCSSLTLFFSNMSLMLRSGVTLTKCFDVLETTFKNPAIKTMVARIRKSTNSGDTLLTAFSNAKFFDAITLRMISVGESTGTLDQRMSYLADTYQERTSRFVEIMGKMIEPIVMALSGGALYLHHHFTHRAGV